MSDVYRINPKAADQDVFHAVSPDPGGEPALIPVNLDYEHFARWLYNFTSPTGPMSVVSWEGLPQVRRDQWMDRIRHGLDDKLGLGEQP